MKRPTFPIITSTEGFTVLEVLVTITLLGAIGTMLAVAMPQLLVLRQLATDAAGVAGLLGDARRTASMTAAPVAVLFDPSSVTFSIDVADRQYTASPSISVRVDGVSSVLGADRPRILFFGDGSSSGGTVFLSDGISNTVLSVNILTGRTDAEGF